VFKPVALKDFFKRTGISKKSFSLSSWQNAGQVVSLRDLKKITQVMAMPTSYLEQLIFNIGLLGDLDNKVYKGCGIKITRIDPNALKIGQTFVERKKYAAIIENFENIFHNFCLPNGVARLNALVVLGQMEDGKFAIAHYLPPIVEEHSGKLLLLDGIHRNFLVKNVGTTIETIIVTRVKVPFPCSVFPWDKITPVDEKPKDKKDRFLNLDDSLFRDVKSIGIDG